MTYYDNGECPEERAAIERAAWIQGADWQAKAYAQRMVGLCADALTQAQMGMLTLFRRQLGSTDALHELLGYVKAEDICQSRIDALAAAVRAQLAASPTAAERSLIFQSGRIAVRAIRDQHATHLALQSRAEEPYHDRLKADADDLFGSAWDRIAREKGLDQ